MPEGSPQQSTQSADVVAWKKGQLDAGLSAEGDDTIVVTAGEGDALAYWDDEDAAWDLLYLNEQLMPGVWEIVSGECSRQVDHKKTKDKDGAKIRDLGLLPARFTAKGQIVTREDWRALQAMLPIINPRTPGKERSPLTIYHPAITLIGVQIVYVEKLRVPEVKKGILEVQIDLLEWTEPKAAKVKVVPKSAGKDWAGIVNTQMTNARMPPPSEQINTPHPLLPAGAGEEDEDEFPMFNTGWFAPTPLRLVGDSRQ
jgi:hypothetical protein